MNYEFFFYFVFACATIAHRRVHKFIIVAATIIGFVVLGLLLDVPQPFYFWSDPITLEFALGGVIALVTRNQKALSRNSQLAIIAASITLFLAGTLLSDYFQEILGPFMSFWRCFFWGIPSAGIVLCAVLASESPSKMIARILMLLGAASFSIYLAHPVVLDTLALLAVHMIEPVGITAATSTTIMCEVVIGSLAIMGGRSCIPLSKRL